MVAHVLGCIVLIVEFFCGYSTNFCKKVQVFVFEASAVIKLYLLTQLLLTSSSRLAVLFIMDVKVALVAVDRVYHIYKAFLVAVTDKDLTCKYNHISLPNGLQSWPHSSTNLCMYANSKHACHNHKYISNTTVFKSQFLFLLQSDHLQKQKKYPTITFVNSSLRKGAALCADCKLEDVV